MDKEIKVAEFTMDHGADNERLIHILASHGYKVWSRQRKSADGNSYPTHIYVELEKQP